MIEASNQPQNSRETLLAPNVIRVFATFWVILFHVSSDYAGGFSVMKPSWLWVGNIIHAPTRTAVPLFFLLSGWLLLSRYDESYQAFFRKRLFRVVPPFLFYVGIFYLWRILFQGKSFTIREIISAILNFRLTIHFWFVYAILGLYLLTPILREIVHKGSKKTQSYIIALWLVNMSVLPFMDEVLGLEVSAPYVFHIGGYLGYFLLGYMLKDFHLERKQRYWAALIIIGCFTVTIVSTYTFSMKQGKLFMYFLSDVNLFNVVAASGLFLILKSLPYPMFYQKYPFTQKIIDSISEVSYGVYLLHPLMIVQLERGTLGLVIDKLVYPPLIGIAILWGFSTITSIVIVWLLHKLPGIKYLVT